MDLSTGEKWAKIATSDDDESDEGKMAAPGAINAEISHDGALTIIENKEEESNRENTGADDDDGGDGQPNRDYVTMHRVMSSLPAEELERFGGLPNLPDLLALPSSDENSKTKLTAAEKEAFEQRMEIIWQQRQEELRKFEEDHIANLPKILQERIAVVKEYLDDVEGSLERVLLKRQQQAQEEQNDQEEQSLETEDVDAPVMADDILSALHDLEYQLSDVDMARDFYTLGGWSYVVALLSDEVHNAPPRGADTVDSNANNKATIIIANDAKAKETLAIIDEIQSLAAMTIGTAVGNLGEFRKWALEDVSRDIQHLLNKTIEVSQEDESGTPLSSTSVSALSLLTHAFEAELNLRSEQMSGMSMTVPSNVDSRSRATFKLRAIYALGSILRGNPPAQQMFVSQLQGHEMLIRDALGTLSNVRGPSSTSKLDYKFASKVLALGEDIVMDVLLHEEEYVTVDESTPLELKEEYTIEGILTANQLVAAFTTERWCDLSLRMLSAPSDIVGDQGAIGIKERALSAVGALGPSCQVMHASAGDDHVWGVGEVMKVRREFNREGSGDGLDPIYRKELLELVDGVLGVLQH